MHVVGRQDLHGSLPVMLRRRAGKQAAEQPDMMTGAAISLVLQPGPLTLSLVPKTSLQLATLKTRHWTLTPHLQGFELVFGHVVQLLQVPLCLSLHPQ